MTALPNPLPHEREHHDTKARILEVAERLFMEYGFSATSLRLLGRTFSDPSSSFGTMAYTNAGMDAINLIASCKTA